MGQYNIKDIQAKLLDNLIAFDQICRQHNLTYYIEAGTLLGAVRHQGFIPWDDDVDVVMPRPDYDRLLAHAAEWLPAPYELHSGSSQQRYLHPFAKLVDASTTVVERRYVMGVYVDIFPIDGMSASPLSQWCHLRRYHFLRKMLYFVCRDPHKHGCGPSAWLTSLVQKCYSYQGIHDKIARLQQQYDYRQCDLVIDHDFNAKGIMPKNYLGTPTPITFESHTFMGVEHPHEYLTQCYGDYMTPPPPEQIHQHAFEFVDLARPYREWVNGEKSNYEK